EVPYRELAGLIDPANLELLNANTSAAYVFTTAVKPSGLSLSYTLVTRIGASGSFIEQDTADWCPTAQLEAAMAIGAGPTTATLINMIDVETVQVGSAALIDDEICRVDAINVETGA